MSKPFYDKKPFPAIVNMAAYEKHKWIILNLLNQIAYGPAGAAIGLVRSYGGTVEEGAALLDAVREIILHPEPVSHGT